MKTRLKLYLVLVLIIPVVHSESFTIMTFNAQNLFDTLDDEGKDDKAYLPLELKQNEEHQRSCSNINVKAWRNECFFLDWNEETKDAKLKILLNNIITYNAGGADVIALQEIENKNILKQLFDLLKPYGYTDYELLDSTDKRGVDTAFISRYKLSNPSLHYVKFSPKFATYDTRPIFKITASINQKEIVIYNLHFPSNFNDLQMRIESFNLLRDLLAKNNEPSIALGDFNLSSKDDTKFNIYSNQQDVWYVSHLEGCKGCKGTHYYSYDKTWSFLDAIFVSRDRGITFNNKSIQLHKTEFNSYADSGRPIRFNAKAKKGVSDHFAVVAEIKLN